MSSTVSIRRFKLIPDIAITNNSLSISPSSVSTYSARAALFGITSWPLDEKWTDYALNRAFLKTKLPDKRHTVPNWSVLNQDLKSKIMTLYLLWEEYTERHPEGCA